MTKQKTPDKLSHWVVLLLCAGALCLAAVMDPAKSDSKMTSVAGFPIPPICGMKNMTGLPCPGCGLTRSWVAAAHGNLKMSLQFNRMGWLLMLYTGLQALRHASILLFPQNYERMKPWGRRLDKAIAPLAILLLANWVWNMIVHFSS